MKEIEELQGFSILGDATKVPVNQASITIDGLTAPPAISFDAEAPARPLWKLRKLLKRLYWFLTDDIRDWLGNYR